MRHARSQVPYYLDPRVAESYDAEHATMAVSREDVPFYVALAKEAAAVGTEVLELGCGTGRVTLPIADAGVAITGIDTSPAMLNVAGEKTGGRPNPRWIEADMRDFCLGVRFGLAIIPFRSFLLLLTFDEQTACLSRIHDHLVPGGRLALNIPNPDIPGGLWSGQSPSRGQGEGIRRPYRNLRTRSVSRGQMECLLSETSFTVDALYGWFDGRRLTDSSGEMVWLARRS